MKGRKAMKQNIKKIIWYIIMGISGLVGMTMLYQAVLRSAFSAQNGFVSYRMVLTFEYPVLCLFILVFCFMGIAGFACLRHRERMDFRMDHQCKAVAVVYGCLQLCLLALMIGETDIFNIAAVLLLSLSLYMCGIWAGNIYQAVKAGI